MTLRTLAIDQVLLWSYSIFLFNSLRMTARPGAGFTVANLYRVRFFHPFFLIAAFDRTKASMACFTLASWAFKRGKGSDSRSC